MKRQYDGGWRTILREFEEGCYLVVHTVVVESPLIVREETLGFPCNATEECEFIRRRNEGEEFRCIRVLSEGETVIFGYSAAIWFTLDHDASSFTPRIQSRVCNALPSDRHWARQLAMRLVGLTRLLVIEHREALRSADGRGGE